MAISKPMVIAMNCNLHYFLHGRVYAQQFYKELFIDKAKIYLPYKEEADKIMYDKYLIYPDIAQLYNEVVANGGVINDN